MPPKKRKAPDNKEDAKREADRLLARYERGEEKISEGNLRIRINRLGKGGRWFKFSSRGGQKRILEGGSPSSSSTEEESEGTLKEQLSMQKIQDVLRTEEKKSSIAEIKSKLSTMTLDEGLDEGLDEDDKKLISDLAEILDEDVEELKKELTTPVKVKEVKSSRPKKPQTRAETKRKQEEQQREIEKKFGKFKPLEGEELKKFRGEREYIPSPKRTTEDKEDYEEFLDFKHDTMPEEKPYVNELMNGEVEKIPNVDDLNQNVAGINEREGRRLVFNEDEDLFTQATRFQEDEKEKSKIDVKEDEYEPLLIPDAEARASREVSNAREYLARRYGERKAQERANLFPELQEESRRLLSNAIENKMQELGMNVPDEIKTMASETLSGLLKDAKIGVSLEDIEGMIQQAGVPVSEIAQQLPSAIASRLPELKSVIGQIAPRIPEGMKNNISAGLGLATDAYGVYDRLPEGMKKKIKEAGGTAKDIAISKIKGSFVREEKEEKEGKEGEPRRIGLFGEPEEDEDEMPEQRRAIPEGEERDPQDLLLEQINNINARLGGLGEGKLAYPEERKTKAYRFPKPNENYDAVQLIQNSTTGFLNELNLYGDVGISDDI